MAVGQYQRTALFSRKQAGGVFTVDDLGEHPGNIWFVDSGNTLASDAAGYGLNPDRPFATLDYAVGQCTASNGDVIYVMPGHAETYTAAADLDLDVIGITIRGLGESALRPTFTLGTVNTVDIDVDAAGITIENCIFYADVDAIAGAIDVNAADFTMRNCVFRDQTAKEPAIWLITDANADRLTLENCEVEGSTGGDANTHFLKAVGVNKLTVRNCRFYGKASTGFIEFHTTACTDALIENCYFYNASAAVTKNVVATVAANTYLVRNCYDGVAGYAIGGSNSRPVGYIGGPIVSTYQSVSPLPDNTSRAAFNFIGGVLIHELAAVVSTEIQAQATNFKFIAQGSQEGAAVDLGAVLSLNAFDVGSVVRATLDFSDALLGADDVSTVEGEAYAARPAMVYSAAVTGAISIHSAVASTGAVLVTLKWEPVTAGAYVVPA